MDKENNSTISSDIEFDDEIYVKHKNNGVLPKIRNCAIFSCFFITTIVFAFIVVTKLRSNSTVKVSTAATNDARENIDKLDNIKQNNSSDKLDSIDSLNNDWNRQYYEDYEKNKVLDKNEKFISPVNGKIIKNFSKEQLVYSNTMEDYRTHKGIDIGTSLGSPVKATRYGVVEKVFENDEKGVTVIISHQGNIKSLYSNLQDLKFISVGSSVNQGEIIGGVGNTSLFECSDPPHLHFEIIENNESVDPNKFINF